MFKKKVFAYYCANSVTVFVATREIKGVPRIVFIFVPCMFMSVIIGTDETDAFDLLSRYAVKNLPVYLVEIRSLAF